MRKTDRAGVRTVPATRKQSSGISGFSIIQYVIIAALLVFIILMLVSGNTKEVEMSEIAARMKEDPQVQLLKEKDMGDAAANFSFDITLVDEGIYFADDDIMNVNELLIVKIEDDTNRQTVIDAVERYLEDKTNSFDGYGTDQFGLLSNAITTERGEYYFFGVSEDVVRWESEFLDCIQ